MKKLLIALLLFFISLSLFSCQKETEDKYEQLETEDKHEQLETEDKHEQLESVSFNTLSYYEMTKQVTNYEEIRDKIIKLSGKLASLVHEEEKDNNYVFSPFSIYLALTMVHTSGDEKVKKEIEEFFDMTEEDIKNTSYIIDYLLTSSTASSETGVFNTLSINNSVWIDDELEAKKEGLKELADINKAESFYTSFKKETASKDISKYIKEKTNGLIDKEFIFSQEVLFSLINTLYCKDSWLEHGDLRVEQRNFSGLTKTDLREFIVGKYQIGVKEETEKMDYFLISSRNGYVLELFVPKAEYEISDIMNSEDIYSVVKTNYKGIDLENNIKYYTRMIFPSYKVTSDISVSDILKENNLLKNSFTSFESKIVSQECMITNITHAAVLDVNKKGFEGAAVTVVAGAGSAAPMEEVYYDFLIDKSFGYILSYKDCPLFIGQIIE